MSPRRHPAPPRRRREPVLALCLLLLAAATLTACTDDKDHRTLRVLASPELADVEPLLKELEDDTGVELKMEYKATADLSGPLGSYDLAWPASDRSYLLRQQEKGERTARPESTAIMRSPVVVGLARAVADRLRRGVPGGRLSWADIADAAADGTLRFGMADPRRSDTGRAALVGVATAAAGTGGALRAKDVSCDRLRGFRSGQTLTGASSRELIDTYVRRQSAADALIAHESELLTLNAAGKLKQPLEIVHPQDGMVLSDFPLMLLDAGEHKAYRKAVDWLRRDDVQKKLMERTWRRPVGPDVPRPAKLRAEIGNALSYPDQLAVVERLMENYGSTGGSGRSAAGDHVVFLLDFSTSMRGRRMADLRAAFADLSGADPTAAGKFARFYRGERLTVVRFAGRVLQERTVTVRGDGDLKALNSFVGKGGFGDDTAVWSALGRGYDVAAGAVADHPRQPLSIVLMTDGENNAGLSYGEFRRRHARLDAAARDVPTFPVHFGEADAGALRRAADATGGRMVDANSSSLSQAFKEIRGCR
ncbi:vWA domain-containing protein [Streptomyces lasiicapitis]|uniref:VWA domain-containing protein n=1 Tax=Streptomyces lasiicapitis TaxID=1923961 RepID=A0ABQ2LYJ9_9ACTN|nr:substrate-binding domain-containing protein [Streptomyces lasiicapitis]GGO44694.1 VWA domain-containing protein [Streptomyces lasiicapitis]